MTIQSCGTWISYSVWYAGDSRDFEKYPYFFVEQNPVLIPISEEYS